MSKRTRKEICDETNAKAGVFLETLLATGDRVTAVRAMGYTGKYPQVRAAQFLARPGVRERLEKMQANKPLLDLVEDLAAALSTGRRPSPFAREISRRAVAKVYAREGMVK